MATLRNLIDTAGNIVQRKLDATIYEWMLQISAAVDAISGIGGTIAEVRYVNTGGNDVTGNGSFDNPFLTVAAAIASITDATAAKPYAVRVEAGVYATAFTLQPFIFVIGAGIETTFLSPTAAQVLGSGFAGAGTKTAGIFSATISTNLVANFAAIASTGAGKVIYQELDLIGSCVLTGATSTSSAFLRDVGWQKFAGSGKNMTITNMSNVDMLGVVGGFGNLVINGADTFFQEVQGTAVSAFGALTIAWTGATPANALDCSFDSQPCYAIPVVTGLGTIYYCFGGEIFYNIIANADIQFDTFTGAGAAGALIANEAGITNLSVNSPGGDITITLRRAANGSRVTVKNQTSNFVSFAYPGAVSFPGSPSYLGPLGYCEIVFVGGVWFTENQTQAGTVTLTNGVSALIPADVSAVSNIRATLRDVNGGTLGAMVCAKLADRVNGTRGTGGGFKLTSVSTVGATVVSDQGIYDWAISPGRT